MKHPVFKTETKKWDNAIGLVVPRTLSHSLHLEAGTQVVLQVVGDRLLVRVMGAAAITLDSILENWPEHDRDEETSWDTPQGNELW
ncbi:AbrB/MazE/SpoVT family DNA-binding domain-containing protein [Deinococcus roseus]|uniref:AbrB/MazE/SpoVT family DNA-binding domain-containing protein n=1 Tax=Deinococcus roseus TaxID=392414 RepID=A0ABQ2DF92_9DEIO|nr:growth regulator [Deinococcus roseus]GGJ55287.1 hypothetical protein GCM10008938_46790 [Deinococcus roseus]